MNNIPPNLLAAIDTIAAGLAKQRQKSVLANSPGVCQYRAKDGCKCAVGWVIPDALYKPEIEGETAEALIYDESFDNWVADLRGDGTNFQLQCALDAFQNFHDYATGSMIPGDRSYEGMLVAHAKDTDEVLAAAIKVELTARAAAVYA